MRQKQIAQLKNQVAQGLAELIVTLEASIPANPASEKNDKLVKPLEAELKKYFDALAITLSEKELAKIYNKHVAKEEAPNA